MLHAEELLITAPVLTPVFSDQHANIKVEVETMRDHLGPDWLQKLTLQRQKAAQTPAQIVRPVLPINVSEDDLYLKGNTPPGEKPISKPGHGENSMTHSSDSVEEFSSPTGSPAKQSSTSDLICEQTDDKDVNENSHKLSEMDQSEITPEAQINVNSTETAENTEQAAKTLVKADKPNLPVSANTSNENAQLIWKRSESETPVDYGKYVFVFRVMSFLLKTHILSREDFEIAM